MKQLICDFIKKQKMLIPAFLLFSMSVEILAKKMSGKHKAGIHRHHRNAP